MPNDQNYWPQNDFHFGVGVTEVIKILTKSTEEENNSYFFINLNGFNLLKFFSDFPNMALKGKKIVIISSTQLIPLAHFCFVECDSVVAVFNSSCHIEEVISILQKNNSKNKISTMASNNTKLNYKDILLLQFFFNEGRSPFSNLIGKKIPCNCRWKLALAQKFGVRKLELLTR